MPDVTYRQLNGRRARGLAGQKLVRRESAEHCLERLLGALRLVVVVFVVRKNNRRIIAGVSQAGALHSHRGTANKCQRGNDGKAAVHAFCGGERVCGNKPEAGRE